MAKKLLKESETVGMQKEAKFRFPAFKRALTNEAVKDIRWALLNGRIAFGRHYFPKVDELALEYSVSENTIRRIRDRKTYKEIE